MMKRLRPKRPPISNLCVARLLTCSIAAFNCWSCSCSSDDNVATTTVEAPDASTSSDASATSDAEVQVVGEWVNFTEGDTVYAIVDGPDDVWFGTWGGLARYQKSSSTWFYYNHGNSGLPCNYILSLALDQQGRVWVGTMHNGLARFDGENWLTLRLPDQQNYSPSVRPLYVDPQGTLWCSSTSGNLYKYDGTWASYYFLNPVSSYDNIFGIARDPQGQLWVSTYATVGTLDEVTGDFVQDTTMPPVGAVENFEIDHAGGIWAGGTQGLAHREAGTWTVYDSSNSGLPDADVTALNEDRNGGMWIGTGAGLAHIQGQNWQTYSIAGLAPEAQTIFSIASSSDDTTWVGTYRQGLYRMRSGAFTREKTVASNLPSDAVYGLAEDSAGTIWAGTPSGLAQWRRGEWSTFDASNSPISAMVRNLVVDIDGRTLWIATKAGLVKYDGATWQTYDTNNSGLPSSSILSVLVDSAGHIWVGTGSGLAVFDGSNWRTYTRSNSPLPTNGINGLALDSRGNVWVGLSVEPEGSGADTVYLPGGVAKFDGQNFQVFTTQDSGLPYDHVIAIAVDENDAVWVAMGSPDGPAHQDVGGLARFDGETWQTFSTANSLLPNNYVQCVTPDGHGSVWVGTYQGLAKYDGNQWQVWHHNDSGLSDEVIWNVLVDHRGNTWIGTGFEGLSVYKPGGVEFEM